jgi:hypothetical protein
MPTWTWIIILCGVTVAFATLVRSLWRDHGERRDKREEAIKAQARWEGAVDADRKKLWDLLKEVRDDVKELLGVGSVRTLGRGSRLSLTKLGKTVSRAIGGKSWAERLSIPFADTTSDMLAYEVQVFCMDHVKKMPLSEKERALILTVAYDHGLREREVRDVLGIELRDKLLAVRKESPSS